jgi:hypothetical protein
MPSAGSRRLRRGIKMTTLQARLYWALIGVSFGVGAVTIFSIGIPLLLLSVTLVLYATSKKMRADGLLLWIALFAMGIAPAILLTFNYVTYDRTTTFYPDGYWVTVLLFGALSLAGIAGGVIMMLRRQRQT